MQGLRRVAFLDQVKNKLGRRREETKVERHLTERGAAGLGPVAASAHTCHVRGCGCALCLHYHEAQSWSVSFKQHQSRDANLHEFVISLLELPFREAVRPSSHGKHNCTGKRGWVGYKQFVGEINSSLRRCSQKMAHASASWALNLKT